MTVFLTQRCYALRWTGPRNSRLCITEGSVIGEKHKHPLVCTAGEKKFLPVKHIPDLILAERIGTGENLTPEKTACCSSFSVICICKKISAYSKF